MNTTKQRGSGWSISLVFNLYKIFGYKFIYYLMYPVTFFYFIFATNVRDALKIYYKHLSENIISRGSNRKGLIAACVYNACKKQKVPRSCKEIAEIFNIELKEITKGCKKFNELWRLYNKNNNLNKNITFQRSSNPLDYIDRFCSKLNIPMDLKYIAEIVSIKAMTSIYNIVNDNTAPSISAGSIYLVCILFNYNITKQNISDISKISEVTISKCYKKLNMYKNVLLPKTIH